MNLKPLIALLFCSLSSANGITWIESAPYDPDTTPLCKEASDWINQQNIDIDKAIEAGITTAPANISVRHFGKIWNADAAYLVTYSSSLTCGTAGCSTSLFIESNGACTAFDAPYTYQAAIGRNGKLLYLPGRSGCGIWEFSDAGLTHVKNLEECSQQSN